MIITDHSDDEIDFRTQKKFESNAINCAQEELLFGVSFQKGHEHICEHEEKDNVEENKTEVDSSADNSSKEQAEIVIAIDNTAATLGEDNSSKEKAEIVIEIVNTAATLGEITVTLDIPDVDASLDNGENAQHWKQTQNKVHPAFLDSFEPRQTKGVSQRSAELRTII